MAITVAITASGNEITDAVRLAALEGDGRAPEASYGVWDAATNRHPNGGFETNTDLWAAYGSGASISRSSTAPKFGDWCLAVTNGCESAAFATLPSDGRLGHVACWVASDPGATFDLTLLDDGTPVATLSGATPEFDADPDWGRLGARFRAETPTGPLTLRIARSGGGNFRLDGVQVEQSFFGYDSHNGHPGTPYIHTDRSATIWPGQPNLYTEADFSGWVPFGTGATVTDNTTSLDVTTDATQHIGAKRESFTTLAGDTLHALSFWLDGPGGESYKVEFAINGVNIAVDFGWTPSAGRQRKILTGTTPSGGGLASIHISKNSVNPVNFSIDTVELHAQPASGDAPYIPDGVRGAASLTAPAAGLLDPANCWFALRVRLGFGTTDPPRGSNRFFRFRDPVLLDQARIEAFYSSGSSHVWGVRRQAGASFPPGAQITSAELPAVRGEHYTIIGVYRPDTLKISVNGSAFGAYAASTNANSEIPTITAETFEITPNLGDGGYDVFWFALGVGDLTDAHAAAIDALGSGSPAPEDFPSLANVRVVWDAEDLSALAVDAATFGTVGRIVIGASGTVRGTRTVHASPTGAFGARRTVRAERGSV